MRHRKKGKKFKRKRDQRRALLRNLAIEFILKGKLQTTKEKAKETSRFVEKLITLAKKNNLASYRLILARLG
ncbi:MAG TPA: 50S ribosomal protein L17, partial [bacterium]|nr:50S ribosomal protein L17 [bacterium]